MRCMPHCSLRMPLQGPHAGNCYGGRCGHHLMGKVQRSLRMAMNSVVVPITIFLPASSGGWCLEVHSPLSS